jgi:gliding motility-associated-like protein
LQLKAPSTGIDSYKWSSGLTTSSINIEQSGSYWIDLLKDNCTYRDSIDILFKPYPNVDLGKDTAMCEGQTLLLDPKNNGALFLWQDNSIAQSFLVKKQGKYFVNVTTKGCTTTDTVQIQYLQKPPNFSIGPDRGFCEGMNIILKPNVQTANDLIYQWQDGSTTKNYSIKNEGVYILSLKNTCGEKSDTAILTKGICDLFVPNAFSPNRDGLNEVFKANFGEGIKDFRLQIFNRWGQLVFESSDIAKGWDGNWKGVPQPIGNYIWLIKYIDRYSIDQKLRGSLFLFR